MVAALPPEGGCGTSLGSQSLPAAPLSPVWHRSRPPRATWPQLQEEPRPPLTACSNQRADQEALASVRVPSHLEPSGISCVDGKRPDGATVMPWRCGQALVWDATCPDTYAPLHLALAARKAGTVANQAEQRRQKSMPTSVPATTSCPLLPRPPMCLDLKHCPCWRS